MEDLIRSFGQSHPATQVQVTYGSSGNLYAQIANHAPFDLFYSADTKYPERLSADGLVLAGSGRTYALGRLALVVRRECAPGGVLDGPGILSTPAIRHLAIANPALAPYGRAAQEALGKLGMGDQVAAKLVLGESVEQAAQFFESGAAEAAFLPRSLALLPPLQRVGLVWVVPAEITPPIAHGLVILGRTASPAQAREFDAFLKGPQGRRILGEHGMDVGE